MYIVFSPHVNCRAGHLHFERVHNVRQATSSHNRQRQKWTSEQRRPNPDQTRLLHIKYCLRYKCGVRFASGKTYTCTRLIHICTCRHTRVRCRCVCRTFQTPISSVCLPHNASLRKLSLDYNSILSGKFKPARSPLIPRDTFKGATMREFTQGYFFKAPNCMA